MATRGIRHPVRLLLLLGPLLLGAALALAAPAGAVAPFGPVVTVASAGCDFAGVTGDAVVASDGVVHGFVAFAGGGCPQNPQIIYFQGSGSSWTQTTSPYHGRVLGVAWDGTATYLLHADGTNIRVTKRVGSTFTGGRLLSASGSGGATVPTGDVVALAGKWWAVWNEQVGPGGEFAQRELFQAYSIGAGHARQRITFTSTLDDLSPSLTLTPARTGNVDLAWVRSDIAQGAFSVLRYAHGAPGAPWSSQQWTPSNRLAFSPDLFLYGGSIFSAYLSDGRVIQATNPPSGVVTNTFGFGGGPKTGSSGGRTWVTYTSNVGSHVRVGEATGPGVASDADLTPGAGPQQAIAVTGRLGKASVFGASFGTDRLWARTQT